MTVFIEKNGPRAGRMERAIGPGLALGALVALLLTGGGAVAQVDPLPSWNEGPTKTAIETFVKATTDPASPKFVPPSGFRVYIVTGGEQDFVRAFADPTYQVPPEQVVGTMLATEYGYDQVGKPTLTKVPRLLLKDDGDGKPQGIHLVIGRRPIIAFGNSDGDKEMLEYTTGGNGPGVALIVMHDDAKREYAYGPANGLPDTKIGTFGQALYDEAKAKGWSVISMKGDWKTIFSFDEK